MTAVVEAAAASLGRNDGLSDHLPITFVLIP